MGDAVPTITTGSPSSPHSSTSSRTGSPARGLRRPASHSRLAKLMLPGRSRASSSASATNEVAYSDEVKSATSGRTTPEQRRRVGKAAATSLLASDAKYKKFAGMVDKSLSSFEQVNEWADFISFLSRLLKTLQSPSPPYNEIPRKLIVSKRLAQCLNPALPSGVHQRALDVYGYIFSTIGTEGLRRDLLTWSSGLFPFFQYAATSVRPLLISLYETHYLPLGDDLRPATKALILALLPAMEEETGDFFDRVYTLFGKLSEAVSPLFFTQNIFLTLISNPSSRLAALNYLSKSLSKPSDILENKSDVGLMIRGVAAVLQDENMLVRRNGLDLLLRITPLDGPIFSESETQDKELLIRAACAVVLQREVSLSRRVYTWLLGKDESAEKQVAYFRTYGLELLAKVLKDDMDSLGLETQSLDAQKPFKVFLSLLDRWEVGAALSNKLVMPALEAIRAGLPRVSASIREEMIDTATAVYEAVEPIIVWRAMFTSLASVEADQKHGDSLLSWVTTSLRQQDEEVLSLHVPIIMEYLLQQQLKAQTTDTRHLTVALDLLKLIPATLLGQSAGEVEHSNPDGEKKWTDLVYGAANPDVQDLMSQAKSRMPPRLVSTIFQLSNSLLSRHPEDTSGSLKVVEMTGILIDAECPSLKNAQSRAWLGCIIKSLPAIDSFELVDGLISIALKASRCPAFEPPLKLSDAHIMTALLDTTMRFLRPQCAPFHARAVDLLWECNQLADPHTLENVVAARLTDPIKQSEAYESFGVLWRLTDDAMLPGELFYTPILTILDGLNSLDPLQRQRAETWIRRNLKSFFRVLDPVLGRLGEANGDLDITAYLLDTVSTILRLGHSDLRSACQTTELRRSAHPAVTRKAATAESMTYIDYTVEVAINHLRKGSENTVNKPKNPSAPKTLLRIQSSALSLLGHLVGEGDIQAASLIAIRDTLIAELRLAIRQSQLTLQTQMLSLLRQCMESHPPSTTKSHQRKRSQINEKSLAVNETDSDIAIVQVMIEGVSLPQNRPILQSWVDFILAIAPVFPKHQSMVLMLCECLSDQLRRVLLQLRAMYRDTTGTSIVVADSESTLLLLALEQMISLIFASNGNARMSEDGGRSHGEGGGTGLMGLVSGVFTVEAPSNEKISDSIEYLDDAINALLLAWSITRQSYAVGPAAISQGRVFAQTRARARAVLERLFKSQASAVIGGSVQVWAARSSDIEDEAIFDCIDHLAPSAQKVVEIVAEAVVGRHGKGGGEAQSDPAIMGFLEVYVSRLEAPIAVQIWNTLFNFARDVLSTSSSTGKAQLYPVLRCVTIVCKTVSTTSALEDRRLRRDLQDVYLKLLDGVVTNANKSAESALWRRDSPDPDRSVEKTGDKDKANDDGLSALHDYIASQVIPNLRSFLSDNDKVGSATATISSGLVQPAFRRQKVDTSVLHVLLELAKLPSATKAWRLQVGEAFNDQRFFKISLKDSNRWKRLICALMDSDRERFGELLGRITAAPSANIFTNREQEMISRSLNLRRLSFILLAAERNHYLAQLPNIQEKLVDILRTDVVSPRVHSEVYLCLRVLMCRISPQHLTNFWPVILTELIKVFESTMDDPPADGSEDLTLILAACKFLDLLLIIQSEDFQVHQWMFVTDTTDAAYPPEDFLPEAIMDRLSEILSEHRHPTGNHAPIELATNDDRSPRKPRLSTIHHLSSLYQLQPFFARASIDTFEGVYGDQGVDWDAVEVGLDREMFESRE